MRAMGLQGHWDEEVIDLLSLVRRQHDACEVHPGSRDAVIQKSLHEWSGWDKVAGSFWSVAAVAVTCSAICWTWLPWVRARQHAGLTVGATPDHDRPSKAKSDNICQNRRVLACNQRRAR